MLLADAATEVLERLIADFIACRDADPESHDDWEGRLSCVRQELAKRRRANIAVVVSNR